MPAIAPEEEANIEAEVKSGEQRTCGVHLLPFGITNQALQRKAFNERVNGTSEPSLCVILNEVKDHYPLYRVGKW